MTIVKQLKEEKKIAELESRQGLYRLFNRLLSKEIDQQFLNELRNPEFADAIDQLGLSLDDLPNDDNLILQQLETEFTRLLLGPGKHISPHESVQIKHGGILNDETTVQVKHFIEATGFEFREDSKNYPDHLSSEFEFMEALIKRNILAVTDDDQEEAEISKMLQDEFIQRHLVQWIPQFCKAIEKSAKLTFYKALARALSDFIQMEYASIESSLIKSSEGSFQMKSVNSFLMSAPQLSERL